jgi:hypothetical protein
MGFITFETAFRAVAADRQSGEVVRAPLARAAAATAEAWEEENG